MVFPWFLPSFPMAFPPTAGPGTRRRLPRPVVAGLRCGRRQGGALHGVGGNGAATAGDQREGPGVRP